MLFQCAVGMTTAPRPRETVLASINSLREQAGYDGPLLVIDDASQAEARLPDVFWEVNNPVRGPLLNWYYLLQRLLLTGSPYIVLLEDDIVWAEGAWHQIGDDLARIEAFGIKNYLYSVYSSHTVSKPLQSVHGQPLRRGIYSMRFNKKAGGSQAWIMTRFAALWLMSEDGFKTRIQKAEMMPFNPSHKKENMNCDRDNQVTAALMRRDIPVFYRIPSLCNHTLGSANSSYWTKREQDTNYFERKAKEVVDVHN